ncbi:unnamed protein product [Spirodela intermedia]|uniref:Uncharacterized protein n=2 Tax=Spirodela intermedia TaxID=51605 RepID=A0A7I8KCV9_SPIIN|nr:unnamed protein product [Spirodela intermedia]CAA6659226.1 unnamed protein product [Spirodela intermedia]CAA6675852.1 unnamed protein product [Spirodela intermedia]CAA7395541.1 unnamed protein product [Spirodela intermedia]
MAEVSTAGRGAPPGASAESCSRYDDDGGDGDGDESETARSEDCSFRDLVPSVPAKP